jgi:hypothetical protein
MSATDDVFNVQMSTPQQMADLLAFFDPFNKMGHHKPCWQRFCLHCDEPIGQIVDPWGHTSHNGHEYGWMHHMDDGPDAYHYCGDEYGTEATPYPIGKPWVPWQLAPDSDKLERWILVNKHDADEEHPSNRIFDTLDEAEAAAEQFNFDDEHCLCGAAMLNGQCSIEGCVCSAGRRQA